MRSTKDCYSPAADMFRNSQKQMSYISMPTSFPPIPNKGFSTTSPSGRDSYPIELGFTGSSFAANRPAGSGPLDWETNKTRSDFSPSRMDASLRSVSSSLGHSTDTAHHKWERHASKQWYQPCRTHHSTTQEAKAHSAFQEGHVYGNSKGLHQHSLSPQSYVYRTVHGGKRIDLSDSLADIYTHTRVVLGGKLEPPQLAHTGFTFRGQQLKENDPSSVEHHGPSARLKNGAYKEEIRYEVNREETKHYIRTLDELPHMKKFVEPRAHLVDESMHTHGLRESAGPKLANLVKERGPSARVRDGAYAVEAKAYHSQLEREYLSNTLEKLPHQHMPKELQYGGQTPALPENEPKPSERLQMGAYQIDTAAALAQEERDAFIKSLEPPVHMDRMEPRSEYETTNIHSLAERERESPSARIRSGAYKEDANHAKNIADREEYMASLDKLAHQQLPNPDFLHHGTGNAHDGPPHPMADLSPMKYQSGVAENYHVVGSGDPVVGAAHPRPS